MFRSFLGGIDRKLTLGAAKSGYWGAGLGLGVSLGVSLVELADEIASGQYALAAIAANLLALAGFSEVFLVVSVLTTSDMSVPPLTLSHTHLPAPIAASGSE